MPIKKTKVKGKTAYKFGDSGKAYTGKSGKSKAVKQMKAMYANGYRGRGK